MVKFFAGFLANSLVAFVLYLAASFVAFNFDPAAWGTLVRIITISTYLTLTVYIAAVLIDS